MLSGVVHENPAHHLRGEREEVSASNLGFKYRKSSFAADDIMLSVTLELPDRPFPEIMEHVKQLNKRRLSSQPLKENSAGCIFKNPPGGSTGKMIDELGLKGMRVGGASVSTLHANFMVTERGARAADLLALTASVRESVRARFGVELDMEVLPIGRQAPAIA